MKRTMAALLRSFDKSLLVGILCAAPVPAALAGPGGTDRPQLAACDTVIPPPPSSFPARVEISGTCRSRHLGSTILTIVQVVDAAGAPSNGVLPITISSQITYAAANGDLLTSTFDGEGSIDFTTGNIAFQGTETYAGGTGRFSDASGTSFLEGHASAVSLNGFYVTLGTLSY